MINMARTFFSIKCFVFKICSCARPCAWLYECEHSHNFSVYQFSLEPWCQTWKETKPSGTTPVVPHYPCYTYTSLLRGAASLRPRKTTKNYKKQQKLHKLHVFPRQVPQILRTADNLIRTIHKSFHKKLADTHGTLDIQKAGSLRPLKTSEKYKYFPNRCHKYLELQRT